MSKNSDSEPTKVVQPVRKSDSAKNAYSQIDDTVPTKVLHAAGNTPPAATAVFGVPNDTTDGVSYTTGWLVIGSGPGKGTSIPLGFANNSIGRGKDQKITLDFGDNSISSKHASIIFDDRNSAFHLARESAKNNIYLNDELVIESRKLKHWDKISFGKTELIFVPFCSDTFSWAEEEE